MREITKTDVDTAKRASIWDLGNSVLYDLCRDNPAHTREDQIIAKVWLIGRSYSASIERRRKVKEIGDDFYESVVAPKMKAAQIDSWFNRLRTNPTPGCANSIYIHKQLQDLFHEITGEKKRSLASKYLHFHFPDVFFIYDSRAQRAITDVTPRLEKLPDIPETNCDPEYKLFVRRCVWLRNEIDEQYATLSPRELDKMLLKIVGK